MKTLILSDTHLLEGESISWANDLAREHSIQLILIAGDVIEQMVFKDQINPYKFIHNKFWSISEQLPIVFCLGNHEFFKRSISETLNLYEENYNPTKYNVHCIDVIGKYEIEDLRIVGNVLWYDGSLGVNPDPYGFVDDTWLDYLIKEFDFEEANLNCQKQILENVGDMNDKSKVKILLTHCVPEISLNLHDDRSKYNFYSGMKDFLRMHPNSFDYSISGHTHFRTIGQDIAGCKCINVGVSDPFHKDHYVLDPTPNKEELSKLCLLPGKDLPVNI